MIRSLRGPSTTERDANLPALALVESPRAFGKLAKALTLLFIAVAAALAFVPWRQNVTGSGRLVALDPIERPQELKAPISGRIVEWKVLEGAQVEQGDVIVEIRDLDPDRLDRLNSQLGSLDEKRRAASAKADYLGDVVASFEDAREAKIESARKKVEMSEQKLEAEREGLAAAQAAESQMQKQVERTRALVKDEIASMQELEIDERKLAELRAKVAQAESYVRSAQADVESARANLQGVSREEQAKVDKARGELEAARGEVALVAKDLNEMQSKIARQRTQIVRAPRDGVVQLLVAGQGQEIVKAGDALAVLVPDATSRVVELYVDGVHAPLIEPGRSVRLQFEGWPAVQFAGWPSVAVGTFGGRVRLVDATANPDGKFRVLVEPNPADPSWPPPENLRQGARTKGWVLLNKVRLGYEIWRRLNGFPPALDKGEKSQQKVKVPK